MICPRLVDRFPRVSKLVAMPALARLNTEVPRTRSGAICPRDQNGVGSLVLELPQSTVPTYLDGDGTMMRPSCPSFETRRPEFACGRPSLGYTSLVPVMPTTEATRLN